ncbi:leucine--tRNA ligase [Patescibacteria group bacterium]|nr:leucine--tRNA ligase [Patescibacteria group bacterium]
MYNPQRIEKKWQKIWGKTGLYKTADKIKRKKNFYCLDMFPYPSGEGLHVGHLHGYIGSDIVSRYFKMKGFNVLHPMGFDAFGLPAENAAIKRKIHPKTWTYKNIRLIRKQLRTIGATYDWEREIITCEPEYYKWTQWMFLQLFKKGLAERAKVACNFCPSCKTVLANEQVVDGKCERCGSEVIQKEIEQWLFKITDYAEDLLKDLEGIDWPERTKTMQRNWIGKSEGYEIKFEIRNSKFEIPVFTTRADTLFGATYLVVAPEHPIISNLKSQISNLKFVEEYIEQSKRKTERERLSEVKDKTGVEIKEVKAINPVNNREIPIFVADYVLFHYGTGAIMAVPCHDQRDFEFARKYNLPMVEVIKPILQEKKLPERAPLVVSDGRFERAYEGEGYLTNSGRFDGMNSEIARQEIGAGLEKKGLAKKRVHYKLRDWLISRQRYWGAPIPMISCQKCGWQPVPEKELPVLLPKIKDYLPVGEGKSPLAKSRKFVETTCPKCGGSAQRETDTMDTFVCSSWYYLRYADPKNDKKFAAKEKLRSWLPVDLYVGGAEHAVMHLLYARFFTKVLKDLRRISFKEPFLKLRHQGTILGPDGQKMSKSKGNVIPIDETIKKYGADTMRLYEMFMGPFEATTAWDTRGIEGCSRFLKKVWKLMSNVKCQMSLYRKRKFSRNLNVKNEKLERLFHQTIKKVTEDIENFRFNTAISALMILVNELVKQPALEIRSLKLVVKLLSPFAPHLTEELWQKIRGCRGLTSTSWRGLTLPEFKSIFQEKWPKYKKELTKEAVITFIIQVNGKVRDKIEVEAGISEEEAKKLTLEREKVKKWFGSKEIKKFIFVPGKLINIVISDNEFVSNKRIRLFVNS